jgi:hypothetical protein
MYAKIRQLNNSVICEETTECTVNKQNKAALSCDVTNYSYCKDFKKHQQGNNWKKSAPYVKYEGCYFDRNCQKTSKPVPTPGPIDCNTRCEYDDGSDYFKKICMPAVDGFGSHSNICYVGTTDPCNLVDSGEDFCPRDPNCISHCCPGNTKPTPKPPHKCIRYTPCKKDNKVKYIINCKFKDTPSFLHKQDARIAGNAFHKYLHECPSNAPSHNF